MKAITDTLPKLSINTMKAKRLSIIKQIYDNNNNLYFNVYTNDNILFIVKDRHENMYLIESANIDKLTFDNLDLLVCSI
jgi:hypothetical protein